MKKILGLDLGTNSIGWSLIEQDFEKKQGKILGIGSRIIPMTQDVLDTFTGGKPLETQTAARTSYRSIRRLRERNLLRRERLHRVLNVLGFLPEHYADQIDFEKRLGKFVDETEPKLAYKNRIFIFKNSFEEMLIDFKQSQPQLFYTKPNGKETKIPYDWTIYYLRKTALSQKIAKEELAWIILNFNQKRGYYQLRGEEEVENPNKLVEFYSLKIVDVIADDKPNNKGEIWYSLQLENGWVYRRSSKTPLFDWKNKVRDFIVTTDLNDDGTIKTDKEGNERRSFRAPGEDDWTLLKKKTENDLTRHIKEYKITNHVDFDGTVGTYVYESLLKNPKQKIRGQLIRTIERKFYKEELIAILKKQIELQPELFTDDLYNDCFRELYRNNEAQQLVLSKRDFVHLFVEDIIFYQRPLRSQKSSIGNCSLEYRIHKDKDGNQVKEYLKAIPKSHPYYQEFRVWQWLSNLKIYRKEDDAEVTIEFLKNREDVVDLFDFLMTQKEVGHKDILKHLVTPVLKEKFPNAKPAAFNKEVDKEIAKYRWNYVFDDSKEREEDKSKKYLCNTTGYEINRRLAKVENVLTNFLTSEIEQHLWHIIYSVTDKKEYEAALKSFAFRYKLDVNSFIEEFRKFPPFPSEYGAYSQKAIKKLLPLMRMGKYWNNDEIPEKINIKAKSIKERLQSIDYNEKDIEKVADDDIKKEVLKSFINVAEFTQGLKLHQALYLVYGETSITNTWQSISDLERYLEDFKQHSLRNPIVEQVITETLRVVRDIWKQYGQGAKDFFSEIHIELGREMKNTADDRKYLTEQMTNNEATNLRIKALLAELKENSDSKLLVENVRPHSLTQQDALRIYEDGVLNSTSELPEDIAKISKSSQPSKAELQRYKLWLEQKYRSPYTGSVIPLGRLFTEDYQIEHIIPKSRYFDDSFNNKVICESAVNQLKDKQLGWEFIKSHHGEKVECGMGKVVEIFTEEAYQTFVKEHYAKNKTKRQNLLLYEIPEKMIARQMNDTRYISKYISSLLSNIVRADKDDDGVNSKNLIPGNGKITSALKQDWGLNNVWNDLVIPRFMRMNELTKTNNFTSINQEGHTIPAMPLELSKGFQKKRIDHRHHAMDALVIACMTRDHVQYLNNENAKSQKFHLQQGLARKLRKFEVVEISKMKKNEKGYWVKSDEKTEKEVPKEFFKPWDNFTIVAKAALETVVVSFKQNLRVINKATNNYQKWVEKNGGKVKETIKQEGTNWAIRKSLHTPMPYGKKTYSFDLLKISESVGKREYIIDDEIKFKVEKVLIDCNGKITEAQKRLKQFPLIDNNGNPIIQTEFRINTEKFRRRQPIAILTNRGQGGVKTIEDAKKVIDKIVDFKIRKDLLKHMEECNEDLDKAFSPEGVENFNSNRKIPIYNLPIGECGSERFCVGNKISTNYKWVEADKGTNLYFAIFESKEGKRSYDSIPLNVVIERLKQGLPPVDLKSENDFYLTPNDLVYLPNEDERINIKNLNPREFSQEQRKNIFKVVSFTGNRLYCIPHSVATPIVNRLEYTQLNKIEFTKEKELLVKLKVDRLGNISM